MIDLFAPGAYARRPGGNLERPHEQRPVIDWMAYNVGDHSSAEWVRARQLWQSVGIATFPWMHCRTMDDVIRLVDIGHADGAKVIGLNIEDVAGDGLKLYEVAAYVKDIWLRPDLERQVHMATLPWVQNDQGWQALDFVVAALEIFPDEQTNIYPGGVHNPTITLQCIEHAFDEGLKQVTLMFKTKAPNTRASYGEQFKVCHSLYTADDIGIGTEAWAAWDTAADGCVKPLPPDQEVPTVPLTETQFPFTGPLYGPSHPDGPTRNRSSVKGLKRGMIRMRYLDQQLGEETDDFGSELERAFKQWWREGPGVGEWTGYGRGSWLLLRSAKLTSGPNKGQYAMDSLALKYVKDDALKMCYPHPAGVQSAICQGLHPTAGLLGNWALDFCARGGTKVLAVENAKITKLSGTDPALGSEDEVGIFGWSIHYETPSGLRYFSTHYGTRHNLWVGKQVDAGQVIGTVGDWPNDPGRSHTHLGVTHPLGSAAAKKRILAIGAAQRVVV